MVDFSIVAKRLEHSPRIATFQFVIIFKPTLLYVEFHLGFRKRDNYLRMAGKYLLGKENVGRCTDAAFKKVLNFERRESTQRKSRQIGLSRVRCYLLRWSRRTRGAGTIRTKQILVNMQMTADNPDLWRPR